MDTDLLCLFYRRECTARHVRYLLVGISPGVVCGQSVCVVYLPRLPITVCIAEEISFLSRPHNVEAGGGQLSGPLTLRHVSDV